MGLGDTRGVVLRAMPVVVAVGESRETVSTGVTCSSCPHRLELAQVVADAVEEPLAAGLGLAPKP